ncbi:MAG: amidohydrolase family protein, partial [Erysipelotrichaceae bacterium]|nr:amidohydrolase family protein [Erysipelotrichaceae bacterium]
MRTLYYNGNIYTGEGKASAFIVEDGRYAEVGNEELNGMSCDAAVDLKGQFVCAAFNDSHMHLLGYGSSLKMADLARHTDSLQGMLEYLREYTAAQDLRPGQWIRGRGWNQDYFSDVQRMPDRHDLDTVSTEYPIVVTRTCGHSCVANTKALELAGIDASTKPPVGGDIGREADGTPDGRLYDNAIDEL